MAELRDALGQRAVIGVLIPSANTIMQPELERLRPPGVSNQVHRFEMPVLEIRTDSDFDELMARMLPLIGPAMEVLATCKPEHVIVGIATEAYGNPQAVAEFQSDLRRRVSCPVTFSADACVAALKAIKVRRVGVISPLMPQGAERANEFLRENGLEVVGHRALHSHRPGRSAHIHEGNVFSCLRSLNDPNIEAFVQFGTNLATVGCTKEIEGLYGKPFVSVNAASYWAALRACNINDHISGYGTLVHDF